MSFYLALVSPLDTPLFELQFPSSRQPPAHSPFPSWSSFTHPNGEVESSASSASGTTAGSGTGAAGAGQGANAGAAAGSGAVSLLAGTGGMGGIGERAPGGPERHVLQMIAHAALDAVEEVAEGTGSLYLKGVDRHNEWTVSAFLATNVKLVLLHDTKNDDGIRLFFGEVWEHYVKVALNPFHTVNTPIRNPLFEAKVRASARKHL